MGYEPGWIKDVYDRAPYVLKNVLTTAYGLRQRRARYGRHYRAFLEQLRRDEHLDSVTLRDRQLQQVRTFLVRAERDSPFHRERFARAGFSPRELAALDQLSSLPLLSKQEVRRDTRRIISERLGELDARWIRTSGTTGTALRFPTSASCFQREHAFRVAHYGWAGLSFDRRERVACVAGHPVAAADRASPPFWSHDHADRWLYMSSYHLSERNLPAYIRELERFQPVMLTGYPSSIHLLAQAWSRWGQRRLPLRAVFTASETLLDHQRRAIEAAFGTKVFVWYGNAEMCANIVECEHGTLHGRLEHSYLEVVDAEGKPAREGRLVCTGFGNDAFPLIRYDIGDIVGRSRAVACPCGRPGELFERVVGRTEDYVRTPDGRYIGCLDHIFRNAANVHEAQVVQRELDVLTLRIVRSPAYGAADERALETAARVRLGPFIAVRFEYVDALERTRSGKFQFVVSALARPAFEGRTW